MMDTLKTLLLSKHEIASLIVLSEAMNAVERVFQAYAHGHIQLPPIIHADVAEGEFHIKAGGYKEGPLPYFTTKINGGFFANEAKYQLPSIQGLIVLSHSQHGYPLAVMDSSIITALRTAAAMGVAVQHLANPNATIATICGCGKQAYWQLRALQEASPAIKTIFVYSRDAQKCKVFSESMSRELQINVIPIQDLNKALQASQIGITCTSSGKYFIKKGMLPPGIFIAAMGADSPDKQEIDPAILAEVKMVVDVQAQCAAVGELHHAIGLGLIDPMTVHIELGQVVSRQVNVRESIDDIIIFDSTGTAMQDTALALLAYEKALQQGLGEYFQF